jgi:hypothetical protein
MEPSIAAVPWFRPIADWMVNIDQTYRPDRRNSGCESKLA